MKSPSPVDPDGRASWSPPAARATACTARRREHRARGARRPWLLAAALLGAAALGACGEPAGGAARYVVVERAQAWTTGSAAAGTGAAPLSLSWAFENPTDSWTAQAESSRTEGRLLLSGRDRVSLTGPRDSPLDPEIHHWLVIQAHTEGVRSLTLLWRGSDEDFDPSRQTSAMPIRSSTGSPQVYSLPLSELRGSVHAQDDLAEFRLHFEGPGPLEVSIDQISLVSDYDDPKGRGFVESRLVRSGIARRGVALAVPGSVATDLSAQAGDVLRLALAAGGTRTPVDVTLRDADGLLEPLRLRLDPAIPWTPAELDLSPLAGRDPVRLLIEASGPHSVLLIGSPLQLRPSLEARPNLVLYVEDTLRADRLGTYGCELPTDPHLRRVADDGIVFEQVFAASSWTRASMSSLMTSLDPIAHGNQHHGARVPETLTTLPEVLAQAGYACAGFVTNFHAGSWAGLGQGFDVEHGPRAGAAYRVESTLTSAVISGPIDAYLEEWRDVQLFVLAHSLDPHAPYLPDEQDLTALGLSPRDNRPLDAYAAEVRHNDRSFEQLDRTLERLGLQDDTLLVFTSDHGEAFGEHGRHEHRKSLHQEEVAIPWVMRLPRRRAAGRRVTEPVYQLDMAPTLLAQLGLDAPIEWEGSDVSGWWTGTDAPRLDRPFLLDVTYLPHDRDDRTHDVAAVVWPYKLITTIEDGGAVPRELYDLQADPAERDNLLAEGRPPHGADIERALTGLRARIVAALQRGMIAPDATRSAEAMDPEMRAWMREMGYLR